MFSIQWTYRYDTRYDVFAMFVACQNVMLAINKFTTDNLLIAGGTDQP